MKSENRVAELFAAVLEKDRREQFAFLKQECGGDFSLFAEVKELLGSHDDARKNNFMSAPALEIEAESLADADEREDRRVGEVFGRYKILERIGAGGMGAIYLAVRTDDYEKRVAVKIIKRGMDSEAITRRFRRERQILANLEHPNIARLIDGGTTADGSPFFVMERIEGAPVDEFCKANNLSETERLDLFRKVCAAVSFAHQKLIVHRDLKPSNILVTKDGEPKLLDFGIAKLLDAAEDSTRTEARVLTPAYASPEQLRGEIVGTSSDVFSLGVILEELLIDKKTPRAEVAGRWKSASDEAKSEKRTNPNSSFATRRPPLLNGDLQNVVLMAKREDAARRYASVEAFSEDVRRYLAGLPIAARKDSASYRASKFIRRNRLAVAVALLFVLSLIGGVAATAWQYRQAERQRALAERRFENLRKSSRSMITEINGALIDLPSTTPARKLLLDRAMEQLDVLAEGAENNALVQIDLGDAYQNLNYLPDKTLDERVTLLDKSIGFYQTVLAADRGNIAARKGLAMDKVNLADIARTRGDIRRAAEANGEAVALLESVIANAPDDAENQTDLWNVYYNHALTLNLQGRAAESLDICRRMTPLAERLAAENPTDLNHNEFRRPYLGRALAGGNLSLLGRYDEAIAEVNSAIAANKEQRAAHPDSLYARLDTAVFKGRLANALEKSGRTEEALAAMREAVAEAERLGADNPKDAFYLTTTARHRILFGQMLARANRFGEAISYFKRAAELDEEILARDATQKHARSDSAAAYGGLGDALAQSGKLDEGISDEQKALQIFDEIGAAKSDDATLRQDCAEVAAQAAENFLRANRADEARALFQKTFDILEPMRASETLSAFDAALLQRTAARLKRQT